MIYILIMWSTGHGIGVAEFATKKACLAAMEYMAAGITTPHAACFPKEVK